MPPADGSVIVLARIRLNSHRRHRSDRSIDTTVRTLGSAKVAPKAIGTAQLADGAVTLAKLANDGATAQRAGDQRHHGRHGQHAQTAHVGENHSARTDNPHATTAAQIDTQGGANQLVAQINAGTGIIARSRLESTVVSGVVTFQNLVSRRWRCSATTSIPDSAPAR